MSDDRLAVEIRDAFERVHEPSPGLEHRVVAAIPWTEPRRRSFSAPRLAGVLVGVLAIVTIGVLVTPIVLDRLNLALPGSQPPIATPAYSLASVSSDGLFVVQRGGPPENALLRSTDGGRTFSDRLHFTGIYDGMQMYGQDGFIWSFDMTPTPCVQAPSGGSCQGGPSQIGHIYRTWDGGATWTAMPSTTFPVDGAYFLDGVHGWIDSGSPMTGMGNDVLYATTDGAKSWKLVGPLPKSAPNGWVYGVGNFRVTFSSVSRGWYLGDSVLYTTADGGRTWNLFGSLHRYAGSTLTFYQPVFSGQEGVLPVAYRGAGPDNATSNVIAFFVSEDGGASWSVQPRTSPAGFAPVGDILSIAVLDPRHIWLTSQSESGGDNVQAGPAVARSSDGGLTWTVVHHTPRILQMTFSDATHGFALDVTGPQNVNGILSTSDAGKTWQRVTVPLFA